MPPLLLGAMGIALLCVMDALIKHASVALAVPVVVCARYAFGLPFALVVWGARGAKPFGRAMLRFHAMRGVVIAVAATGFFYGLTLLPLAEAVTISFIAPLVIPFIAWALLGERPRRASLAAGAIGFVGVLVAASGGEAAPPGGDRALGIAATLGSALVFALAIVLLRARASTDGPARVNVLGSAFPLLATLPLAVASGDAPAPADLPALVAIGFLGTAGMSFYASAYARAQAQLLAPLEYTALAWAALIGWFAFAERPAPTLFLGAAIIIAATFVAGWDERRARAAITPPA